MAMLHEKFPIYCWNKNKAYPTAEHRQAIKNHGITTFHRLTFDFTGEKKLLPKTPRKKKSKSDKNELSLF